MDTLADIVQAVQDDFTVGEESALYSPTLIKRAINRAYRKAGALFPWPELMDAKKTSTQANQEYYDYPQTWRSNSIWKLTIEDSDSNDKKWSHQWRRFFIWPIPTTTGSNNISVWGIMVTETLSDDSDVTIFSYSAFEGNEAIVLEAVAILKSKGEQEKAGEFRSIEAKQILTTYWRKIQKEMAKDEKNMPFFEVIDMFGTGTTSNQDLRGRFDIDLP